jgi:hypothetical protein
MHTEKATEDFTAQKEENVFLFLLDFLTLEDWTDTLS